MKKCRKCGTTNKDASVFCLECGKRLTDGKRQPPDAEESRSPLGVYIIAGCLVVALLAGGIASLLIFGRDSKPDKSVLESADELINSVTGLDESKESSSKRTKPQKHAVPVPTHEPAEPVRAGNLVIEVNGSERSAGESIQRPARGKSFLVVDLTIKNAGARATSVSSLLQMFALDPAGNRYDTALYFPPGRLPEGAIQPGGAARGKIAFEVPSGRRGFYFVFEPEVLAGGADIGFRL
jgi:hypothetical protein